MLVDVVTSYHVPSEVTNNSCEKVIEDALSDLIVYRSFMRLNHAVAHTPEAEGEESTGKSSEEGRVGVKVF